MEPHRLPSHISKTVPLTIHVGHHTSRRSALPEICPTRGTPPNRALFGRATSAAVVPLVGRAQRGMAAP